MKIIFSNIIKIKRSEIFKVFSYSALSTLVRMITAFISIKFIAITIGASGVALIGQLSNFSTIIMTFACGGINTGITKYIAEYKESQNDVKELISTGFIITVFFTLISSFFLLFFHDLLSQIILKDNRFNFIFVIFGATIFMYTFNMFFAAVLNGFKEFKNFVILNISGSVVGLFFTLLLVYFFGLKGALVGSITYQSVIFFLSIYLIRNNEWFNLDFFKRKFNSFFAKKYFKYSLMTFVSAATSPVSQLILRSHVISEMSSIQAGWWEALNRISNIYLMVFTTSFSLYYLPRLSEITDKSELKKEVFNVFKNLIPILLVGFVGIYFLRAYIIQILFAPSFIPMENLFFWQLFGDFFKISSWVLAFIMVAKAMTGTYVITEIIFSMLFVILGFAFINLNGLLGIPQAMALTYFFYLICMLIVFRKLIFGKNEVE